MGLKKRRQTMAEGRALVEGWTYDLRDRPREKGQTMAEGQALIEGWISGVRDRPTT